MTANELRAARKELDLSQRELAPLLDVVHTTVLRWERGLIDPIPLLVRREVRRLLAVHRRKLHTTSAIAKL